jgi:restriction endonuclease Mrr
MYVSGPVARQILTLGTLEANDTIPWANQRQLAFEREAGYSADVYIAVPEISGPQGLAVCGTEVTIVEFSNELLANLRRNPADLLKLTPEQFELFLCDRLHAMGMEPRRIGSIYEPDGGIDIVAWPRRSAFPFLVGVQAKHHGNWKKKVGAGDVREFDAVIRNRQLNAGLLVSNTSFTPSASWEVQNHKHLIRLRDFEDLRRWIADNFVDQAEWREIPDPFEYAPGKFIRLRP